ncbi:MAG: hypothetical protein M3Y85_11900 [Bacteroidota bacterium]|nr:hypothetical protein [Bacteroidota bacterium]
MKTEKDTFLILSGIRALTGQITSSLRSASIELHDKKVIFKCVFDETASDDDFELVAIAAAEIIADFPNCSLEEIFQKIDQPASTNPLKNVLYHRHESNC